MPESDEDARERRGAWRSRRTMVDRLAADVLVEALTTRLADDARVKAYEIVGERERAVSIMERRVGSSGRPMAG